MEHIALIFVSFILLLNSFATTQLIYPQGNVGQKNLLSKLNASLETSSKIQLNSPVVINFNLTNKQSEKPAPNKIPFNSTNDKTQPLVVTSQTTQPAEIINTDSTISEVDEKAGELGPGAIGRAVVVFVLISFVFLLYVGLKTCRRKKVNKSKIFVRRKYGVRTTRGDVEMEPLPLSDDEDDNTIFDSRLNLIPERDSINK